MTRWHAARDPMKSGAASHPRWQAAVSPNAVVGQPPGSLASVYVGPDGFPDLSGVPGLGSLVADLRRAREAGVPVGDPNLTAFALWGVVHGFASLAVTQPDIPHDWLVLGLHRAYAGLLHGED